MELLGQRLGRRDSTSTEGFASEKKSVETMSRREEIASRDGKDSTSPQHSAKAGGLPELEEPRRYSPPSLLGEVMDVFILYETGLQFVLVATDRKKERCAMLRIDRSFPSSLVFGEDQNVYTWQECEQELKHLADSSPAGSGGFQTVGHFHGLVGFIRFTSSYYMGLISKASLVGVVAGHEVYSADMIQYFQVFNTPTPASLKRSEDRYLKYLTAHDLTRDCYFSSSYNLTATLQTNMGGRPASGGPVAEMRDLFVWNHNLLTQGNFLSTIRRKFWGTVILHGHFEQRSYTFLTRQVTLTLISRRSRHFAGKRYLKRGVTFDGHVANEVETEQILSDVGIGRHVRHSAFVQLRGSVPLFWSQVTDAMVPKPDIVLYRFDPLYEATQTHLQNLLARYASPVFLLDTVKQTEKRPRETKLGGELASVIEIIKNALEDEGEHDDIQLIRWDFNANKKKNRDGLEDELKKVAARILHGTGFFCSHQPALHTSSMPIQRGVVRTNCVDCLDRTNVCQFGISRVALSHQLAAHGIWLEQDKEKDKAGGIHRMLSQMYCELGNRIAQQYAGTDAQEKNASWAPQAKIKSVLVSINRYYQNSFTDADKQKAIDLFLGVFKPTADGAPLWETDTDSHMIRQMSIEEFERGESDLVVPDGADVVTDSWIRRAMRMFYELPAPEDPVMARKRAGVASMGSFVSRRFIKLGDTASPNQRSDSALSGSDHEDSSQARMRDLCFEKAYEEGTLSSFDDLLRRSHVENFGVSDRTPSASSIAAASVEPSESGSAPNSPALSIADRKGLPAGRQRSAESLMRFLTPVLAPFSKKLNVLSFEEEQDSDDGSTRSKNVKPSHGGVRGRMPWLYTPEGAQIRQPDDSAYAKYARGELNQKGIDYNPQAVLNMSLSPDAEVCRRYRHYFDCSLDKMCSQQSATRDASPLYVFTSDSAPQVATYRKSLVDDLDPSRRQQTSDPQPDNWVFL